MRPAIAISDKEVEALLGRLFEQLRQKSCGGSVGATSSTIVPISAVGVERMVPESLDDMKRMKEGNVEQGAPAHGRIASGERGMTGGDDGGTSIGDGTEREDGGTEGQATTNNSSSNTCSSIISGSSSSGSSTSTSRKISWGMEQPRVVAANSSCSRGGASLAVVVMVEACRPCTC